MKSFGRLILSAAVSLIVTMGLLLFFSFSAQADNITVTNNNDSGPGSLRQALLSVSVGSIITFDLTAFPPDNPATITLLSLLPEIITGSLTINGSGAGVIIDGSQLSSVYDDGLRITSNNNTIMGLTIQNFPGDGVDIRDGAQGNRIENCVIRDNGRGGTGRRGVRVDGSGTTGNTITRNSITGNDGPGIKNSDGGNRELPWPIITQITTGPSDITVRGFAQPGVTVEVFADPATEGQIFLGDDLVDGTRRFTVFSSTASLESMNMTATAIDGQGNTSEFAQALVWPLSRSTTPDGSFSSAFGPRLKASEDYRYDFHRGLDTYAMTNTAIYAVANGEVRVAGTHPAYDSTVVQLCHPTCDQAEYCSNYLHVLTNTVPVSPGHPVEQGDVIGYTGESESGFPHLHFEIREGGLYQKDAVNPFKYLPYDDTVDHTVVINGVYMHTPGPEDPTVTARAIVTALRNELDFNRITIMVDNGSKTDQRTIDFQALNKEMTTVENPEILDKPYINDVCIMPTRFNRYSDDYRIDFVFYGLQGGNSVTLTAEAADVHSNVVTTPDLPQAAGGITIFPDFAELWVSPGMTGTYVHTLTNTTGDTHTFTLDTLSAHGQERWNVHVIPSNVTLGPGMSAAITVTIAVSDAVATGTIDCIAIMAISGDGIQAIAVGVITASRVYLPIIIKNYPP